MRRVELAKPRRFTPRAVGALWLVTIALAALALGVLVYVLDRPAASVYFLPYGFSFATGHRAYFGAVGGQLPDFVHVYAFILLTAAFVSRPARIPSICLFWWAVDTLFKFGEHPAIAPHLAAATPAWFRHVPVLDNTASYFLRGTFDPLDLIAIAVGAVAGYLTVVSILAGRLPKKSMTGPSSTG